MQTEAWTSEEENRPAPSSMIGVRLILAAFWRARALGLTYVGLCVFLMLLYIGLVRQPVYEAAAIIGPVPNSASSAPQGAAAALAGLAGVASDDSSGATFSKFTRVLTSTRLAARLERDHGAMKMLIGGWNPGEQKWEPPSGVAAWTTGLVKSVLGMPAWTEPTVEDLAAKLSTMVSVNPAAGSDPLQLRAQFYSVTVESRDRQMAARLLGWILQAADSLVREDQMIRTEGRIAYLTKTLNSTNDVALRDYLNQVMVGQEQTLMTLKADQHFAFDLVDPPSVPTRTVGFSNLTLLVLAVLFGFLIVVALMFLELQERMDAHFRTGKDPLADPFPNPIHQAIGSARRLFGGKP